jgi:hypothetical protein
MGGHVCHCSTWEAKVEAGELRIRGQPELHSETLPQKQKEWQQGDWGYSSEVVHLTSKPEAPSTAKKERKVWVLVAHSCGASYSGGRDQDDCSSKPARANSSRDPILKNPITKNWTSGVAQSEGPEYKTQYHKKKKKKGREWKEMKEDKKTRVSPSLQGSCL